MAYRPSAGRNQRGSGGPKEPDLIPIMNLFMTLIPFMLLMMVITQVALVALNFSGSSGGGGGGGTGPGGDAVKEKKIEVIIMSPNTPERSGMFPGFEIREPGQEAVKIPIAQGYYDFRTLNSVLKEIHTRNPEQTEINVSPYPDVLYGPLIQTIDLCKENEFINVMYRPTDVRVM